MRKPQSGRFHRNCLLCWIVQEQWNLLIGDFDPSLSHLSLSGPSSCFCYFQGPHSKGLLYTLYTSLWALWVHEPQCPQEENTEIKGKVHFHSSVDPFCAIGEVLNGVFAGVQLQSSCAGAEQTPQSTELSLFSSCVLCILGLRSHVAKLKTCEYKVQEEDGQVVWNITPKRITGCRLWMMS